MVETDTKLLAQYDSPVFKRFYKRKRVDVVDGKSEIPEKYEMDMVMFKNVIRPILRQLLTHANVKESVSAQE